MSKKFENESDNVNQNKEKVLEKKGESLDASNKSPPNEQEPKVVLASSREINLDLLEERRKSLSEEHEKLLANNRVLQEEVLRLKTKIDKCDSSDRNQMEELKRKIKASVPEEKHTEIDKIFCDWIANLKVHTINDKEDNSKAAGVVIPNPGLLDDKCEQPEKLPLKIQIEGLKKQIECFKQKMKAYKESDVSTTDLALSEVKEEIGRVREGITKMRENLTKVDPRKVDAENIELITKLDEVKQFLENLK